MIIIALNVDVSKAKFELRRTKMCHNDNERILKNFAELPLINRPPGGLNDSLNK